MRAVRPWPSRYPVLDHKYVRFADTNNDYLRADLLVGR